MQPTVGDLASVTLEPDPRGRARGRRSYRHRGAGSSRFRGQRTEPQRTEDRGQQTGKQGDASSSPSVFCSLSSALYFFFAGGPRKNSPAAVVITGWPES